MQPRTTGHISQPLAGAQRRVPSGSRAVHVPVISSLTEAAGAVLPRAAQNPFLHPPLNVGIHLKPSRHLGGTSHTGLPICLPLSLYIYCLWSSPSAPPSFLSAQKRRGSVCFLNTIPYFPQHILRSVLSHAPISIFIAASFCFLEEVTRQLTALANFTTHFWTVLLMFSLATVSFVR